MLIFVFILYDFFPCPVMQIIERYLGENLHGSDAHGHVNLSGNQPGDQNGVNGAYYPPGNALYQAHNMTVATDVSAIGFGK
jgi:hypothetical protein